MPLGRRLSLSQYRQDDLYDFFSPLAIYIIVQVPFFSECFCQQNYMPFKHQLRIHENNLILRPPIASIHASERLGYCFKICKLKS